MRRISLAIAIGTIATLFGSGCRVVVTGSGTYESCFDTSDCSDSRDRCVQFPGSGGGAQNACSYECIDDSDCDFGGRCLSFDSGVNFFCVQSCTTSSQCEIGWECNDLGDGRANACLPGSSLPTADTFETCSTSIACGVSGDSCVDAGGTGLAICTYGCTDDGDCESGSRCLSLDGGSAFVCLETCSSSGSCESGWSCNTIDSGPAACLPGTTPVGISAYDECLFGTTPNPCESGTECWGVTVDTVMAGLCTDECSVDSDCPLDPRGFLGTCLAFPGQPALCFEGCGSAADCAPGWACKTSANGLTFPSICVPM